MPTFKPAELLELCVLGAPKTGKTNLIKQFIHNETYRETPDEQKPTFVMHASSEVTYGTDFNTTMRETTNKKYRLKINDMGSDNETFLTKQLLHKQQHAFIVVIKLEDNLCEIEAIAQAVNAYSCCFKNSPNAPIVIAINQFRQSQNTEIPSLEDCRSHFFEEFRDRVKLISVCNVKANRGVDELFDKAYTIALGSQRATPQNSRPQADENSQLLTRRNGESKEPGCCERRCSMM
ncbi:MAG: hypothetical protein COV52_04910 [Gammaproteobacteria bacterium CG11_big_fil_rev_8_21_14_0_20_46_22]|nr:MAG: hypothetical protein COW05_01355 [Gammaproteobacteria bacterium CG12_big_fil_rev_8_21_14_0_65_46_12]PIR11237.1 MAG: hypothetical protein COV52_04910 [Gammaproteobacteria bacterium CG11_big_fil_rev_8_21_14_0_20_46_22]